VFELPAAFIYCASFIKGKEKIGMGLIEQTLEALRGPRNIEKALENLRLDLSSPRERSTGTISSYTQTARSFLEWLGSMLPPTSRDFKRYFVYRRQKGVSERTLAKEFVHLQRLALANSWDWPFTKADRPVSRDEVFAPAFTPEDVELLIKSRPAYNKQELFYLAVSTTWGRRREEMAVIKKRDYNEISIKLSNAKQRSGPRLSEKLIPEETREVLLSYHPQVVALSTLSQVFGRILEKASMEQRKGWGWHSIRRSLETAIQWKLAENQLPLSLVGDFMDWSKTRRGTAFGGAPMVGVYTHHEVMLSGDFAVDRLIIPIHPFLPLWRDSNTNPTPGSEVNKGGQL
jgi:hypothetical protein